MKIEQLIFEGKEYKCTCEPGDKDPDCPKHGLEPMDVGDALDENHNPEYDDEAGMADNNLETMRRAVDGLDDLINTGDNLPEWCQEKIAVAKSMLVAVATSDSPSMCGVTTALTLPPRDNCCGDVTGIRNNSL